MNVPRAVLLSMASKLHWLAKSKDEPEMLRERVGEVADDLKELATTILTTRTTVENGKPLIELKVHRFDPVQVQAALDKAVKIAGLGDARGDKEAQ